MLRAALPCAAGLAITCATVEPPRRIFPADQRYPDSCPTLDIRRGEIVELTVLEAHHTEREMLLATCEDGRLPGCSDAYCPARSTSPASKRIVCLPGKVYRRLYESAAGAEMPRVGTKVTTVPFCLRHGCDMGLALWVLAEDESVKRWTDCHLIGGRVVFLDQRDPARSVRFSCRIVDISGQSEPRECYPIY